MSWKIILVALLLFVLSAAGAFWYRDSRDLAIEETGWCCMRASEACVKSPTVDACASGGGVMFDLSPFVCNASCGAVSPSR